MSLRSKTARADRLARNIDLDRSAIEREQTCMVSALRKTARHPATLAWAFAIGTLVGARESARSASTTGRVAGAVGIVARTWSKVRLLGSLTQGI